MERPASPGKHEPMFMEIVKRNERNLEKKKEVIIDMDSRECRNKFHDDRETIWAAA